MNSYSLSHLTDHTLLQVLTALATQDRETTAALLAHLAEVDERKLYLPAAYPSMYMYCVQELRMSEDMALKRIQIARAARDFPAIFSAVADGRLHLTAVVLLAPHLKAETADELLAAAGHKSMAELKLLLAERSPKPDVPTLVEPIADPIVADSSGTRPMEGPAEQLVSKPVPSADSNSQGWMEPLSSLAGSRATLAPLSPGRFALQVTLDQGTHDQLRYAQSLLGHALPSGDVALVLKRALDALVCKLEQQKFAKSARSGNRCGAANGRHVPADIRRTVWQRDGGQCTFVSESGKRCEALSRIEFDHVHEVARGGQTTAACVRLRCRGHNQYTAEQTFGVDFMQGKREEAKRSAADAKARARAKARADARAHAEAEARAKADAKAQAQARERDVIPWLRALGFSAEIARRAAANCAHIPDASLEERARVLCRSLAPNCVRRAAPVAGSAR